MPQLITIVILLVLNGLLAGSEIAMISLREGQLRQLRDSSPAGRALAKLSHDPNRYLATIQLGITLSGLLASATAAVTLAEFLMPVFVLFGPVAEPVAVLTITLGLTFLMLVFGELTPKRVAMQHAERWALLVARPLYLLSTIAAPAVWLLGRATNLMVRVFGSDPDKARAEVSPAEIRDLVAAHQQLTPEQRLIIVGAIGITERRLRQVLVPRRDVFTLDADLSLKQASVQLAASGHSRAPVARDRNLDDTIGVANLRDLVTGGGRGLGDRLRSALTLPDSLPAGEALRRFQTEREQFALVVDERGIICGIVTLEDLVEEILGNFYDETDPPDGQPVQRDQDGSVVLPGTFLVEDLPDVGVRLGEVPAGDYLTVAGMIIAVVGDVPAPGRMVTIDGWRLTVLAVDGLAVTRVRCVGPPPDDRPMVADAEVGA